MQIKIESDTPTSTDSATSRGRVLSLHDNPCGSPQGKLTNRLGRTKFVMPQVLVLVVMLLLVLYAMHEAGDPKNWEWMGFKNPPAQNDPGSTPQPEVPSDTSVNSQPQFKSIGNSTGSQTPPPSSDGQSELEPKPIKVDADLSAISSAVKADKAVTAVKARQTSSGPALEIASEFWRSIIDKMKPHQQATLMTMLRSMRRGEPLAPETVESCSSLVSIISKNRDKFHQELFDQLTLTTDGTQEKKDLSTGLFDSQAVWEQEILPALKATVQGEDFTLAQLQSIHQLQTIIDPILFDQVQDKTAIGWTGDSETWKRIWEIVAGTPAGALELKEPTPSFKSVTRIELMSQPEFYRGQPVSVEGWVRSARRSEVGPNSELGISQKYTMWIRPKETKQGPYCVYAHQLPDDFPELTQQFQDLNEQVRIEGYFFKIRTYVGNDKDQSVLTSPVIVASAMTRIAPIEYASPHNWQPSRLTLIIAFLLMPVLATAIAWWAFRLSKTNSYKPGKKTANKIDKTLGALASDPNVQTDREKVQALYDSELYDSESDYQDRTIDQESDVDE